MRKATVRHKNLNEGKETELLYPIAQSEFQAQFSEIFDVEHYKEGIRGKNLVYVDLGANIGLTTLYFAPYAREYYAVEPSTACFEALTANTKHLRHIKRFNFAIYPKNGREYLVQTAQDSAPQTFFAHANGSFGRELVETKRIDTFFEENTIKHVDVMKVDIESSEYALFPDPSFIKVADRIDCIIGEAHYNQFTGTIPEFVPLILNEAGFKTKFLDHVNMEYRFHYTDSEKNEKTYIHRAKTIFLATRT